jgi:hypothetical protein
MLTAIYISTIVYAFVSSVGRNVPNDDISDGKKPIDYGILRAYRAEKRETPPTEEWYTLEQLGIALGEKVEYAEKETYHVLIVEPEKALPWMKDYTNTPVVNYGDQYYQITSLWLTVNDPTSNGIYIPIGGALGIGWLLCGILFVRGKKLR